VIGNGRPQCPMLDSARAETRIDPSQRFDQGTHSTESLRHGIQKQDYDKNDAQLWLEALTLPEIAFVRHCTGRAAGAAAATTTAAAAT